VPVMDVRFANVEARFARVDAQFSELLRDMASLETRLTNKMMALGVSVTGIIVSVMLYLLKK
jgi:hypothetical protein